MVNYRFIVISLRNINLRVVIDQREINHVLWHICYHARDTSLVNVLEYHWNFSENIPISSHLNSHSITRSLNWNDKSIDISTWDRLKLWISGIDLHGPNPNPPKTLLTSKLIKIKASIFYFFLYIFRIKK